MQMWCFIEINLSACIMSIKKCIRYSLLEKNQQNLRDEYTWAVIIVIKYELTRYSNKVHNS